MNELLPSLALLLAVAWGAPALTLRVLRPVLSRCTTRNYRGREVYLGLGWAWFAWALGVYLLHALSSLDLPIADIVPDPAVLAFAPVGLVVGAFALGWLDDRFGTGEYRGLKGHFRALGQGRLTTGLVKLVGIAVLAVVYGYQVGAARGHVSPDLIRWPLAFLAIAASANLVNLTDLRPGRALKAYAALVLIALAAASAPMLQGDGLGWRAAGAILLLGPVVAIWPYDLGERAMLGDAGANAAGALAGWALAVALPLPALATAAVVLVALNLASERVSFSAVIEGNRVLRAVDRWGRASAEDPAETTARGQRDRDAQAVVPEGSGEKAESE